jgi:hypothetical protein
MHRDVTNLPPPDGNRIIAAQALVWPSAATIPVQPMGYYGDDE